MKAGMIALTKQGQQLQENIQEVFRFVTMPGALGEPIEWEVFPEGGNLDEWIGSRFNECDVLIFITAAGIAVRKIAPHLSSKLTDPAVLVLDSAGEYVIPLLSGHVGGANAIALQLSKAIDARCVITTATDVEGRFAWDVWAKENDFGILEKEGIVRVSSALLRKEDISLWISPRLSVTGEPPDQTHLTRGRIRADVIIACDHAEAAAAMDTSVLKNENAVPLILFPKRYIIGLGCKKNTDPGVLENRLLAVMERMHIQMEEVAAFTTIDIKKNEEALLSLSRKYHVKLHAYSSEALADTEGEFSSSSFVADTVGVDNVCERSAMRFARDREETAHFILKKYAGEGTTIAIARRDVSAVFSKEQKNND